ncbi:MAG TPA: cysteine--tRNA ligase [Opitutaceae bacterium]|nr:cysteine--tRNA ligase [Opitutaceae bacterium]
MALRLFDSLQREIRELRRPDPTNARDTFTFYNCGPTVYAPAHIGNFRTFLINDVLRRVLELEYGAERVKHVRNLTDVDDRTIGQSRKEGRPLAEITKKWTEIFHADCAALNCLPPHVEPTATGHIAEQVNMIDVLLEKGNAYRAADGSVYFKVSSFPDYGHLSRIHERELKVTNTIADADHKDDVSDFALWKAYKPEEDGDVKWQGPRGASEGRPGWHIECSAMSKKHLGDTIDLHTGGVDLLFPHHENEIAQSQCCNGTTFSRHWYHSEHLLVNGTTMSKSKGNYYTLADLVAKGYSPMAVRFALLSGHPRKQLNFTLESLHAAESALKKLQALADRTLTAAGKSVSDLYDVREILAHRQDSSLPSRGLASLHDDLNTPGAFGELFSERKSDGTSTDPLADFRGLARILFALGLNLHPSPATQVAVPDAVRELAERRWAAKQAKDFKSADTLRGEIAAAGWTMLDRKDGYSLEPKK